MGLFNKSLGTFEVVVHLDGRHPYLEGNELDMETRDVTLTVPAKDWNHAEKVALQAAFRLRSWKYWIVSMKKVRP